MGLFTRKTAAVDAGWIPDGMPVTSSGDIAGDIQDGDSYTIGFANDELPGCHITITYYAVQYAEWGGDEWGVERHVEWSIRDDDGEPLWDESQTNLLNETVIDSQQEAEEKAAAWAAEDNSDGGAQLYGTWDGEAFDPGDAG